MLGTLCRAPLHVQANLANPGLAASASGASRRRVRAAGNDTSVGAHPSAGASLQDTDASVEADSKSAAMDGGGTEHPSLRRAGPLAVAHSLEPTSTISASISDGHAGDSERASTSRTKRILLMHRRHDNE